MEVDGVDRWYLRDVPPTYDGSTPMPVVMDLHGFAEGAKLQAMISGLGAYGDAHGFITLTPNGHGTPVYWNASLGSPDLRFLGDLVDQAEAQMCVDQARVYVTGYSNGAYMTSSMACQYADRIAAIAPVAGLTDTEGCHPSRPVPVMAFHGTGDQFVPFDGGIGPKGATLQLPDGSGRTMAQADPNSALLKSLVPGGMKPIEDNARAWATRNGCHPAPSETKVAADVTLQTFSCPADGAVELYVVAGGGHAWPGSAASAKLASVTGPTTMSIDATKLMWQFFVAHPMPAS
jgi:polyhydroxybutyrate depolymerase